MAKQTVLFLGHVDHGKSSLFGKILVDNNKINLHSVDKIRKLYGNNFLSRLIDEFDEEREKSKTMEWSTTLIDNIEFIDTPGHSCYIRSTIDALEHIADTSNITIVCINAGDFPIDEHRQTKELVILARSIGIKEFIVVWTFSVKPTMVQRKYVKKLLGKIVDEYEIDVYSKNNSTIELFNSLKTYITPIQRLEGNYSFPDVSCEVMLMSTKKIVVSTGFKAIIYINKQEYDFEVTSSGFFVIGNIPERRKIKIRIKQPPQKLSGNLRIILRTENLTIGFGKIV